MNNPQAATGGGSHATRFERTRRRDAGGLRRSFGPLWSLVFAFLVVSGCGDDEAFMTPAGQTQPSARSTATSGYPISTAPPLIAEPVREVVAWRVPPSLLVKSAHLIVTGTVVDILPGRWTTLNGARPTDPAAAFNRGEATIVTPVVVQLSGDPIVNRVGDASVSTLESGRVVIAAFGGTAPPDAIIVRDGLDHYELGERVLVVLNGFGGGFRPDGLVPTEAGLAWSVYAKYTIGDSGELLPANGGEQERFDVFVAQLAEAAAFEPPIHPTPPVLPPAVPSPSPAASPIVVPSHTASPGTPTSE